MPRLISRSLALVLGLGVALAGAKLAQATGNVAMALDGMIANNTGGGQQGWGGYGRFTYGAITIGTPTTAGLGRYDGFTVAEPGTGGSGIGVNFALASPAIDSPRDSLGGPIMPVTNQMFPLLDRASFGINFDPTQYVAELIYKPLPGNTATQLNMTLDTHDGFDNNGNRLGEQWQWAFTDLVNKYNTAQAGSNLDANGFARVTSNQDVLSQAAAGFNGPSFMFASSLLTEDGHLPTAQRDQTADFNDFEGGVLQVPNGAVQIHLQTVYGGAGQALIDNWEIKSLRVRKITQDPNEIVRLDARSGLSQRFGSPFERNPSPLINVGGVDYDPLNTDQYSRFNASGFTNIVINTDDDSAVGGVGIWQPAQTQSFDGASAMMEVRAKLTAPLAGQADHIVVVAKDKDGNGTGGADLGGEEFHWNVPMNSFNQGGMTTLSLPFSAAAIIQAQEFANAGDNSASNFNLYYLGLQTDQSAGLVDLEVEYVRIVLPGQAGDFDGDEDVDGNDFLRWQRGLGTEFDALDLVDWKNNFGATGVAVVGAVPEPASVALVLGAALGLTAARRRRGAST